LAAHTRCEVSIGIWAISACGQFRRNPHAAYFHQTPFFLRRMACLFEALYFLGNDVRLLPCARQVYDAAVINACEPDDRNRQSGK